MTLDDYTKIEKILDYLENINKHNPIIVNVDNRQIFSKTNIYKEKYKKNDISILNDTVNYSLSSYIEEETLLNNMIKDIKKSNLSPFEKYIQIYNIVKNFKPYKENYFKPFKSRNLNEFLYNDYMVCVGYAKLLNTLLEKIDIPSYDYSVDVDTSYDEGFTQEEISVEKVGHARLIINLNDEKYGINGYYISDPTWDNDLDQDYLMHSVITFKEEENQKRLFWNNFESYIFGNESFTEYVEKVNKWFEKKDYNQLDNFFDTNIYKSYKDSYEGTANDILNIFINLDPNYYEYLKKKYLDSDKILGTNFNETNYNEFLTDVGNHILEKTNKKVDRKTIINANIEGKIELGKAKKEELEEKKKNIITEDMLKYNEKFPYKDSKNIWEYNSKKNK